MAQHLTRYDSSNTLAWSIALSERQTRRFRRLPGWLAPLLRSARGRQPSPHPTGHRSTAAQVPWRRGACPLAHEPRGHRPVRARESDRRHARILCVFKCTESALVK